MKVTDFIGAEVEISGDANAVPLARIMDGAKNAAAATVQHVSCGGSAMAIQWSPRQP